MTLGSSGRRLAPSIVIAITATEFVTLGSLVVPLFVGLSLRVSAVKPVHLSPEQALSVVASVGAVAALLANATAGWLSDLTRRRFAGRVPWIVVGAATGAAAVVAMPRADSFTGLVACWALAQASYNTAFSAVIGTISDLAPATDRTRITGWWTAGACASAVVGLGIVSLFSRSTFVLFDLMPLLSLPVVAAAAWTLHRAARVTSPGRSLAVALNEPPVPHWRVRFWALALQNLLTYLAYSCAMLYGVFYLVRRVALPVEDAASATAASVAAGAALAVAAAVGGARWATRTGRSDVALRVGGGAILLGLVLLAFGSTRSGYSLAMAATGIGYGMCGAASVGLAIRVVPSERAGRYLGVLNAARILPQALAPALGPALLALGSGDLVGADRSQNFVAFYLLAAVCALGGIVAVTRVGLRSAAPEPPRLQEAA